ncbi:MAG: hypothetical protein V4722_19005 [Bacteroidota bacterium]
MDYWVIIVDSQYTFSGNAVNLRGNSFRLTQAINSQSGVVWFQNKISLGSDLVVDANIYLGNNNDGSDGMAFLLQPVCNDLGGLGGCIGYCGVTQSLAVEFDIWQNNLWRGGVSPGECDVAGTYNVTATDNCSNCSAHFQYLE